MISCLRIILLINLVIIGTNTQGFDLADAFGDDDPTAAPPVPKVPEKPKDPSPGFDLSDAFSVDDPEPEKPAVVPPKDGGTGDFDLLDAFGDEPTAAPAPAPAPAPVDPKKPAGDGFDLYDALGPDPEPDKPAVVPPKDGGTGGGSFGDEDLFNLGGGDYKPDGGKGGARASDPASDPNGGAAADQPQEAGSSQIAGIVSGIGVALLGAASGYFAYQKKKLCFKLQGGVDPESGKDHQGTQSEPQVLSNLLSSS